MCSLEWPSWLAPGAATPVPPPPTPAQVTLAAVPPPPPPPPPPPVVAEEGFSPAASSFEIDLLSEVVKDASVTEPSRRRGRQALLDRRDWLLLLAGAGALLVVQVLGWLVGRLVRLWR